MPKVGTDPSPQSVVIVGAGIAGLGTAIALAARGFEVTVLDRDPAAPEGGPDSAFAEWDRRGAAQFRHSHVFLARLHNLLRDNYPDLLDKLWAAGCRALRFEDSLSPVLERSYRPRPEDADLTIVSSRRATLELVMRDYTEAQSNIEIVANMPVTGLLMDNTAHRPLHITGVSAADGREFLANIVIDASGRTSQFPAWLRNAGGRIAEETAPAGILYYTRHYRLRPGQQEPPRSTAPSVGDLGYIKFGVFRADNGWFSLTLAVPEIESALRKQVTNPESFDRICALLPGVQPWTDPARSEPMSGVFAMGGLQSVWRHYMRGPRPVALGFFAVGDSVIRTNPLYGRGCSAGFLQGHLLADILAGTSDPVERAAVYYRVQLKEIRPYYDIMVKQDDQAIRRAQNERNLAYRPRLKARLVKRFIEDGIGPASRGDIKVLRALMRGFHMLEDPRIALKDPEILARIMRIWARGPSRNRALRAPELGPERARMFKLLGIFGE